MVTKMNVDDEATKWGKGLNCEHDSRCMHGPAFLDEDEKDWPNNKFEVEDTEEELRSAVVCSLLIISYHR